jgi:hypothetical protein
MNSDNIPDDDSVLEERLRNRPMPEPLTSLRSQVLRAVTHELESRAFRSSSRGTSEFLKFAAAMAAVLVIGLNVARTAISVTPFELTTIHSGQSVSDVAALQRLSPDLSGDDARRMAVLLQVGGDLTPLPQVHRSAPSGSDAAINGNIERPFQ